MLSKTRSTPVYSSGPGVIPDTAAVHNGAPVARESGAAPAQPSAQTSTGAETRGRRFRRKAHRSRLHAYAILAVALLVFLIRLAIANTANVKVSWVFASSHVSLVWLVLFAAILGWALGLVATAAFHWRTRAPRPQPGARS